MTSTSSKPPADSSQPSFFAGVLAHRHFVTVRLLIAVAVVAAAAWGARSLAVASDPTDEPSTAVRAMPVETYTLEASSQYNRARSYTGQIVAARRSTLAFERAGKVESLSVDEGDVVEAGQPLAVLDQRRLRAQRSETAARLQEARAMLAELESGPRKQTIAAAAAEVQSLQAQQDVAEKNLDRRQRLVDTRAISREEFEESLYLVRAATARTDVAQKTLDELEAGTRGEQIDAQRARVEALEAALADADHQIEDSTLTAPYAGRLARRMVDEGAVVATGAGVFELIESDRLEAWIGVPPAVAATLRESDSYPLVIAGRRVQAELRSLRPELDPSTRTRNAVLDIEAPYGLVDGQVARIELTETIEEPGFWVPTRALAPQQRGLWSLYIVAPSENAEGYVLEGRDVELLHTDGDRSYVRGVLEAGDRVVADGVHRVVAGQHVRPTGRRS